MASVLPRSTSVRLPALAILVLLLMSVTTVQSSQGDKEPVYRDCVKHCVRTNCTGARLRGFQSAQPQYMALTVSCLSVPMFEVGHVVMTVAISACGPPWASTRPRGTVSHSSTASGHLHASCVLKSQRLPWPLCLMAWPAFSCCCAIGAQYRARAPCTTPSTPSLWYLLMPGSGLQCFTPETPISQRKWTISVQQQSFFTLSTYAVSGMLYNRTLGLRRPGVSSMVGVLLILAFTSHVSYLTFVSFDYGYNMAANASIGMVNLLWWLCWCWQNRRTLPYWWKCGLVVLLLHGLALLELLDFPPLLWILDAHAVWHLSTIPVHFLFYSFLIDDSLYLLNTEKMGVKVE
uniref:post-GPI attachment to proteins factor 3 isoform X1 n=1 Tax=Monopterus albus TaxID=43700 RepID=UPI0009B46C3C|nr:post-GPI attachment to proteins factor 3 isoform X1 [Monopterus albus]